MTAQIEQPKDRPHTLKTNNIYKRGPNKQEHNKKHAKIWQTASPGLVAL